MSNIEVCIASFFLMEKDILTLRKLEKHVILRYSDLVCRKFIWRYYFLLSYINLECSDWKQAHHFFTQIQQHFQVYESNYEFLRI